MFKWVEEPAKEMREQKQKLEMLNKIAFKLNKNVEHEEEEDGKNIEKQSILSPQELAIKKYLESQ